MLSITYNYKENTPPSSQLCWTSQCANNQPIAGPAVPSPRGALVGLAPLNKAPSPPKLNNETLYISIAFANFRMSSPPAQTQSPPAETQSPPIENFWRRFCETVTHYNDVLITFTSKTTKQHHGSFFSKLVKQTNHSMLIFT